MNDTIWMDKEQAKRQLKLGVALLRGEKCNQPFYWALKDAMYLRDCLKRDGFTQMASTLNIWIGKAYAAQDFL